MNARYLYPGNPGNLENQQEAEWKVPQEYGFPVSHINDNQSC